MTLTKAQFKKEAVEVRAQIEKKLRALIREDVHPFDDNSKEAKRERIESCKNDPEKFLRTYLPHLCPVKSAPFHFEINEAAQIIERLVIIAAFRGAAKTTRATILDFLMDICYERERFMLVGSETEDQATNITMQIKIELEENQRIKNDFGDLTGYPWKNHDFYTSNGIRVKSRGRDQRIRGLVNRGSRPTKFNGEDIEDDESAQSKEQAKKTLNWIRSKVIPGLEPTGWKVRILGQIFDKRGAINQLIEEKDDDDKPKHFVLVIRVEDEEGNSVWPERFPKSALKNIKDTIGLVAYLKEYMLRPPDPSGLFPAEWFENCWYDYDDIDPAAMIKCIADDPSIGIIGRDYSAIIAVGYDPSKGEFYVLDCVIDWLRTSDNVAVTQMQGQQYPDAFMAVESNGFQELLAEDVAEANLTIAVLLIDNKQISKPTRIAKLSPLIQVAKIKFDKKRGHTKLLIEQLMYFGKEKDDGPDALQIGVEALQRRLKGIGDHKSVKKRETALALKEY